MKIKYLGTAAAEGVPGMFCECPVCKKSWELGGKNIRTRSQALIDDKILIDFNADTYMHELKYNFRLSKIDTILITHIHEDHYYPQDFGNRRLGFAHMDGCNNVTIIGSEDINEPRLNEMVRLSGEDKPNTIKIQTIKPGETITVQGYSITAIKAIHGSENPLNYIISKDGKTLPLCLF